MNSKKYLLLILCLFISCLKKSIAQTCTGSLGDPIVNITFGAGSDFGPPLPAGTTSSLQFQPATCPSDGFYSIVNFTSGCWPYDVVWHTATDHTGNPDGYYMLVNASSDPSNFYIQTINGLCEGTTYQFAAWILNMCSVMGIKPNITFTIEKTDGTIIGKYDTGDIPIVNPVTWTQYGLYFTTPAGVNTVVLRMRNNSPGGVGNDLGLDDITFRAAGPAIDATIKGNAGDTINICAGNLKTFQFESTIENCYSSSAYQWQLSVDDGASWNNIPGATGSSYTRLPTAAGKYLYRLNVAEAANINIATCRVSSNPLVIHVNPLPAATVVNNGPRCSGDTIILKATGGMLYTWTGPNSFSAGDSQVVINNATVNNDGKYYVKVMNEFGCEQVDSTVVTIFPAPVADFNSSSPACEKNTLKFYDQSLTNGLLLQQWNWNFGDGATATTNTPTHIFTSAGAYTVSLSVENNKGCKSKLVTKNVIVHPLPVPDFLMPAICLADKFAAFINTSAIKDNTLDQFRYQWNFGDSNASPANNLSSYKSPAHAFNAIGIYPVQLQVTSGNGCVKDTLKNFTVNGSQPVANFLIDPSVSFCSNTDIIITDASSVNFGSIARIEIYWDYIGNPTRVIVDSFSFPGKKYTHRYKDFGNPLTKEMTVRYVVYSGISCVNEMVQKITIKASPAITFSALNNICAGAGSFALTQAVEINGLTGTGTYTGEGVNASGVFDPSSAGTGDHTIRYDFLAANNCTAFAEQSIKVFEQPVANAGPDRTMLSGGFISLDASAAGNGLLYEWTPNTSIENNHVIVPKISPVQDIAYTLKVVSADGCEAKDEVLVTVVKDIFVPTAFSPNGDGLNDTWRIPFIDSYNGASVQVFNRYGEVVFQGKGKMIMWDGKYKGEQQPAGSYVWLLNAGSGRKIMHGTVTIVR